jgi:glycosyltransferase involved in cell wall biosynthesis
MPLRILVMADTPPDPNRGAAGTEMQTIAALRDRGHAVDALWADDLGRRIEHGNLHLLLELPRTYERAAVRMLRAKRYDVVHINQPHGFRAARAVHRLDHSTAVIHRSHGIELNAEEILRPWREKWGAEKRSLARRLASRGMTALLARHTWACARESDGHIVSSSLDADFLMYHLGVDRAKIAVVPQAAPEDYLRVPTQPLTAGRLRRVLHVAQFAFFKAPMITAEAMNRLAVAEPDLRFTWVCDRANHGAVRALLSSEANARLELLHWMAQDALLEVYDSSGLFLFPSFYEGFGKAFLEAMSRGLCVIASNAGGMRDLIEDGRNGHIIPPGNSESLADAALATIRNLDRAQAMSADAVATAGQYTWERVAREIATFYEARLRSRA